MTSCWDCASVDNNHLVGGGGVDQSDVASNLSPREPEGS